MSKGFIQLSRSEKSFWLLAKHPNAFLLLTLICLRANRYSTSPDGYFIGECHIGDYEACGLKTEKTYIVAKKRLEKEGFVKIIETCRNRKKGATGRTTLGTKVKLISSDIYDINMEEQGDPKVNRGATEGRPRGDEQEDKQDKKRKEKIINLIDGDENLADLFVAKCKGSPGVISISKGYLKEEFQKEGFTIPEITCVLETFLKANKTLKGTTKNTLIKYLRSMLNNQRTDSCKNPKSHKKNSKSSSKTDKDKSLDQGTSEPILERLMRQNGLN